MDSEADFARLADNLALKSDGKVRILQYRARRALNRRVCTRLFRLSRLFCIKIGKCGKQDRTRGMDLPIAA